MGRWGDGEMGRWGDGGRRRWGDGEQRGKGNKSTSDRCLEMYITFASLRVMSGKDAKIVLRLIYGLGRLIERIRSSEFGIRN
ncbi:MAG: hypothetical protein KME17_00640 [Cyanosarcina radialis HA8281-LM2]|nr:hypothetical protein [Cyanosarcina radialis HA8281-LM2]